MMRGKVHGKQAGVRISMQKIIILGAGGTLGQELVKKYKQSDAKFLV